MNLSRALMRGPALMAIGVSAMALTGCAATGFEQMPKQAFNAPVHNPRAAGLPTPASGFGWYRDGSEYVLANKLTGMVARTAPAPKELARTVDGFGYTEH